MLLPFYSAAVMGSEKRERQKANRAARLAEQQKRVKRQRLFRNARTVGIVAVIVFGAAVLFSLLSGSSDGDDTTTTTAAESTTTTTPEEAPQATSYELFASQPTACGADAPAAPTDLTYTEPEDQEIPEDATVTAVVSTSCGDLTFELDPAAAPETVNSFVFLARQGFFDGVASHRIVPGFVIQAGDPTATGTGGPGYTIPDELPAGDDPYPEGTLAMANNGSPGSGGSQFFITVDDISGRLTPTFTVFGRLIAGQETIDAILDIPLGFNAGGIPERSRPLQSIYIESVTIDVA